MWENLYIFFCSYPSSHEKLSTLLKGASVLPFANGCKGLGIWHILAAEKKTTTSTRRLHDLTIRHLERSPSSFFYSIMIAFVVWYTKWHSDFINSLPARCFQALQDASHKIKKNRSLDSREHARFAGVHSPVAVQVILGGVVVDGE